MRKKVEEEMVCVGMEVEGRNKKWGKTVPSVFDATNGRAGDTWPTER